MQQLEPTYCPSELKMGAVYQIDGTLYQFLYSDPYARVDYPKFVFRCLPGQRRKADLILNKNNITYRFTLLNHLFELSGPI